MWFEHLTGKEGMCRPAAPKVALRSLHKIEFLASFWKIRILTVFLNKFFKTEVSTAKFKFQLESLNGENSDAIFGPCPF